MSLFSDAAKYLRGERESKNASLQGAVRDQNLLWKLCKDLWEKSENKTEYVKKCFGYYDGELINTLQANFYFPDQTKTNYNIVNSISETKVNNILDAQFAISVIPDFASFYDLSAIKDIRDVADMLNDEVKNIFKNNEMETISELVARYGELCGFSGSQTMWDTETRKDGEVTIKHHPSDCIRWNKGAKQGKINCIGVIETYTPIEAKSKYGRLDDGSFDEDLCKKIDEIAEVKIGKDYRTQTGNVINYANTSNNTGGRAFVEAGVSGIQTGKEVSVITLYLLDDSVYAPDEKDTEEEQSLKQEYVRAYPNGRIITFSLNEKDKLILRDDPASESFKNLGNIDIYNPIYTNELSGRSGVDIIFPLQDRINGLFAKYREKISYDFDTLAGPEDFADDNSIVRSGYTKMENFAQERVPVALSNNGIAKGIELLEAIEKLIKGAYDLAHVNATMVSGERQAGTTSGDQVEALQESPMVDIRSRQRNFRDWYVKVAEKCVMYIIENYSEQRLIEMSSNSLGATMAQIKTDSEGQKSIEFMQDIQGAIKTIKSVAFRDDWKFRVSCTAGTEIPRSRRENARLADEIVASPLMSSGNIDMIELYLEAKDFPNRRAVMSLLRKQADEKAKNPQPLADKMLADPKLMDAAANMFKAMTGFSKAQGQWLQKLGLDPTTDTITTAPAQAVTSKSQAKDIAVVAPQQISENPVQARFGHEQAQRIEEMQALKHQIKPEMNVIR